LDNELLNDSLPPQNIEAEQAVLGAVFLSPDALADAMEFVEAKDFYRRAHQLLFQAMIDLNDDGEAIDVLTVNNRLEMNNQLDDVGGVAYIAELASSVPTAASTRRTTSTACQIGGRKSCLTPGDRSGNQYHHSSKRTR